MKSMNAEEHMHPRYAVQQLLMLPDNSVKQLEYRTANLQPQYRTHSLLILHTHYDDDLVVLQI